MPGELKWELVAQHSSTTEGPIWDGTRFLYSEIGSSKIWALDLDRGQRTLWRDDTVGTNGLCVDHDGSVLGCQGVGRRIVRYRHGVPTEILTDAHAGRRYNEPNDLVVDTMGRIWFSDPNYYERPMQQDSEAVYRLDPAPHAVADGWTPHRVTTDTARPNGILLSADEKALYVADSPKNPARARQLRSYPIDGHGNLGPAIVLHDFGAGRGIDGMCLVEGDLILATAGHFATGTGPALHLFDERGSLLATHPTPVDKPTNCAFGGHSLDVLLVTFGGGEVYAIPDSGMRHVGFSAEA